MIIIDNCKDHRDNTDTGNINNEEPAADEGINREALLEELDILNLSLDTIYVIAIAVVMNIEFVKVSRDRVLDQLNNTNISESEPDVTHWPRVTNLMFLYATGIFLTINLQAYLKVLELPEDQVTQKEKNRAWKAFISSFLIYIATCLSRANLEV
ncbi:hypothetical protein ACQPU1_08770 [Clostridium paraputrificum]|uniref:hypothetical protein n=1 Tax=Clostridium TaxID=1485 RepID=UPI003D32F410